MFIFNELSFISEFNEDAFFTLELSIDNEVSSVSLDILVKSNSSSPLILTELTFDRLSHNASNCSWLNDV